MASETSQGRRRTNSSVSSLPLRQASKPKQPIQPISNHTKDEFLQDFLDPSFEPAAFLNAKLPPLAQKSAYSQAISSRAVPIADLSAQAQTLLSQLNAHTNRLSDTLTQLTDDILRSGSRLTYEVELLRGETQGLSEMLNETLADDIKMFVPDAGKEKKGEGKDAVKDGEALSGQGEGTTEEPSEEPSINPPYVKKLQTLILVRERLDSVVKTFGEAMDFVFPPSELSVGSSFLSVSAPDPSSDQQSSEEKGQQVLKKLREEISELLNKSDDPVQGIEKAANRIEELKELNKVWKGTAEEKGRSKFIENLARMVEDRHRELIRETEQAVRKGGYVDASRSERAGSGRDGASGEEAAKAPPGGFGLISQLQKLRNGL